ncbi:MAG: glutamine--fructose-6-phosphate aminotransferase, partial [Firmicutes bacterium]|nr:glutamine--fructose-6-phosphate aminotransferase [Bacillota bacterium]
MCGIIGFTGSQNAAPILLDGLSRMEYRGYDSAGIAVLNRGAIEVEKAQGRLTNLLEKTDNGKRPQGFAGIGHTR